MTDLSKLIERVEADGAFDRELNEEVAQVFGWHVRKVTRLGLNGRTPGSWLWFPPNDAFGHQGSRMPQPFLGPPSRRRALERSEEGRVGKGGDITCQSWWMRYIEKLHKKM